MYFIMPKLLIQIGRFAPAEPTPMVDRALNSGDFWICAKVT